MLLLYTLFLLLLTSLSSTLTVSKCCPIGQIINPGSLTCVETDAILEHDLAWFPVDALYNGSSLKPASAEEQQEVVSWLKEPGVIQTGGFNVTKNCEYSGYKKTYFEMFFIVVKERRLELLTTVPSIDGYELTFDDAWMLPIEESCLDFFPDKGLFILFYCPGPSKPWIHKCCQLGHMLNATSEPAACVPIPARLKIPDWKPHNTSGLLGAHFLKAPKGPDFPNCQELTGCENCTVKMLQSPDRAYRCRGFRIDHKVNFLASGAVKVDNSTWEPNFYCGDRSWHTGGHIYANNIFYCPKPVKVAPFKMVYGILFIAGGFCLLLTVAISLYLPELRRRIHNKIAITHNATLMVAHFIWGTSQFAPNLGIGMCSVMCLSIQFTFLGSLFWLNAMCINMSSTFRNTQTISGQSMRSEARRYGMYSLYAWGLTALVSIFTVSMEFAEETPYGLPRPGFSCYCDFARETSSVFVYFYAPMAMVLILNLVLYIFTTWKIMSVQKQTKILHHTDSNATGGGASQNDKQRLILYSKLFLLMGLTWSTEIIGWAAGATDGSFWMILDIINLLRAVFIFILFVCKRPVLRSLRDRLEMYMGRIPRRSGSSTRSTTDAISLSTLGPSRRPSQIEESVRKKSRGEQGAGEKRGSKQLKEEERKMETVVSESDEEGEESEMIKTNGRISFNLK